MNRILNYSFIGYFLILFILSYLNYSYIQDNFQIYLFNAFFFLAYYSILVICYNWPIRRVRHLVFVVLIYNLVFVSILTQLFFSHHGNYFSFNAIDSIYYHELASSYLNLPFFDSVIALFQEVPIDDFGFPFFLSIAYRIFDNPLAARYLMIVITVANSVLIFKNGNYFLTRRFSFLAALIVTISQMTVLYESNGLKELFMMHILLFSFYFFNVFQERRKIRHLIYSILISLILLFFRIPLAFLFLLSISLTMIFVNKFNHGYKLFLYIIIAVTSLILYLYFQVEVYRFLDISSETALLRVSESVKQEGLFVQVVSILTGLIGPFPTLMPISEKLDVSLISGGLVLRVFLAIHIVIGVFYVITKRMVYLFPFVVFIVVTIVSLISISEVFEYRFHLPHYPFLILTGLFAVQNRYISERMIIAFSFVVVSIVLYWNFGRL